MPETKSRETNRETQNNHKDTFQDYTHAMNEHIAALSAMGSNGMRHWMNFQQSHVSLMQQFNRDIQNQNLEYANVWFEKMMQLQKGSVKSFHDYAQQWQEVNVKNQHVFEDVMQDAINKGMDWVNPSVSRRNG
ncbi:MAG: hypothetical protein K2X01_07000 [Cyanobacteria bacterium]|nr:hypothetical protein [Cyanobacteriota bacterium]